MTMRKPTIHANGTSAKELTDTYRGESAINGAADEHDERMSILRSLKDDLDLLLHYVVNGGHSK